MSILHSCFLCEDALHSCVIDDNGRVAYAYLLQDKEIISDLWLYNQAMTPQVPEWKDRTKMPFMNPSEYVHVSSMAAPLEYKDQIAIAWKLDANGILVELLISLRGVVYGRLAPGAKPGWNIAVAKDGPLARRLLPVRPAR